ncbi:nicotinamide riboside kinase 1 [Cephus cinctus]|uniref:Nicotinamide riboside kinase 1 n=1 Tax=Cephus cinctus TaxID=211228 RepID=A0AAJ7BKN6_CEPCN|nr:nicotinamide riboside kinase 1 [Cephus cinctus]
MMNKKLVIGIAGITCSGKSTLATKIQSLIPDSIILNQDDYFLPADDPRHVYIAELHHQNWDIITSVDMEKMYTDLLKWINNDIEQSSPSVQTRVLILEGFLIFNYEPIANLCNMKFFLTLNKEECWERRKERSYDPPDVPGYFEMVVWPEYIRHKSELDQNKKLYDSIVFIDGSRTQQDIFNIVSSAIIERLA